MIVMMVDIEMMKVNDDDGCEDYCCDDGDDDNKDGWKYDQK